MVSLYENVLYYILLIFYNIDNFSDEYTSTVDDDQEYTLTPQSEDQTTTRIKQAEFENNKSLKQQNGSSSSSSLQEFPTTSDHDVLPLPLTQSIKIKYKSEYRTELETYIADLMTPDDFNANNVIETWSILFTHIIVEILARISSVSHFPYDPTLGKYPQSSLFLKYILIEELYNDNYNSEHYDLVGIRQMAIHPGSTNFPILKRYPVTIFCHINGNKERDEINIDFFNTTDENIFNDFFDAFRKNIDAIIDVYFKKISFYYILDEYKEYKLEHKLITNRYNIGLLTDPDELI